MYNYGAPGYTPQPPGYAGPPPGMAPPGMAPPGMAPPPGTLIPGAPPGVYGPPPGLGAPRNLPADFRAPVAMPPDFDFRAPVIRLGSGAQGQRAPDSRAPARRAGLGMDSHMRDADRREMQQLVPPKHEEIARTIFVGNIPQGVGGDEGMERILSSAGNLARWIRATDANNKPQTFGFAEYQDAQSLETAAEIFKDVHVPTKRQEPGVKKDSGVNKDSGVKKDSGEEQDSGQEQEAENSEVEKTTLLFMVDQASIKYAEEWKARRGDDETTTQFRIETAKEVLDQVVASLFNPPYPLPTDHSGDVHMQDVRQDGDGPEVANYVIAAEDELADIPADMREMVAAEIAAFRDRSNRRDQERLRREEEIEAEERRRAGRRNSGPVGPPPSAPTGPGGAAGVNGVPLGPRADRGIQGAPSGPKGGMFPRDYQGGVNFINGGVQHKGVYINREDDDDPASDSEIERRREKKRTDEFDDMYRKKLRDFLKYEGRNATGLDRTGERAKNEEEVKQKLRQAQAKYLENFDDDMEESKKSIPYYRDHPAFMRERESIRHRELKEDAKDREEEQRDLAIHQKKQEVARGLADSFLEQQAEELSKAPARAAAPFKLSLGAAAKKIEQASAPRRTVADVENMLDDEAVDDEPTTKKKRTLIPINFDASVRANLTAEEIVEAQQQLAREIPSSKDGLWKWKVSWEHLSTKSIETDIKNWAEKKILDIMGIQEDLLVDAIVEHLKSRGDPQALVDNLVLPLDDEAEALVKKLWRMVIYYSEQEKRGIK